MAGVLLVDFMNILHAANGMKSMRVGSVPTQGTFGFLRSLRAAINRFPQLTPIVLLDGYSWRYAAYPDYKASRDAPAKTRADEKRLELREQVRVQKPYVRAALEALGVRQVHALNLEADDLAGILSRKAIANKQPAILLSGDKDWIQLIGPGIAWLDPIESNRVTPSTLPKRFGWCPDKGKLRMFARDQDEATGFIGVPSARAWLQIKALAGDKSDEIDGVGGIGERRALDLVREYGSVEEFLNRSIDGTLPKLPKYLADFSGDANGQQALYRRNMMLMDLNSPDIPAPAPMIVTRGAFDTQKFSDLCSELMFQSILNDFDEWTRPFREMK